MPITAQDLVHNPDFSFADLQTAQRLVAALTAPPVLGPESSFCPHPAECRIYDPHDDEVVCTKCGDIVSHTQLEAERTQTAEPEIELP
jgi:hypothetical protein